MVNDDTVIHVENFVRGTMGRWGIWAYEIQHTNDENIWLLELH